MSQPDAINMTRGEAIARLLELAKSRIETMDGEWGCSHTYQEALTNRRVLFDWEDPDSPTTFLCQMHHEALEVAALEAILTVVVTR